MIDNLEKEIIKMVYENIMNKGEYPNFGSPEIHCDKCMFYRVACRPYSDIVVGCFLGWKREQEENYIL